MDDAMDDDRYDDMDDGDMDDDGMDDTSFVDKDGDLWHTDEYGDRSYMWDYM